MTTSVAVSGLGTGIASKIDTTSLIAKLVAAQSVPITTLQTQETGVQTQISTIASISSALTALQTAATNLSSSGVLGMSAAYPTTAGYTATPGTGAQPGSYQIQVDALATAAKWHSAGLSSTDTLQAGTFTVSAEGQSYSVQVAAGSTLSDLATALKSQGAPVTATVLNDGTHSYLSLTATQTGYDTTSSSGAASALSVGFTPSDASSGVDPTSTSSANPAVGTAATNAAFTVDGLSFSRRSNTVTDVVPNTTLTLTEATGTADTLTLSTDASSTQTNLQSFVTAYNAVMSLVQAQLDVTATTDRTSTLAGDSSMQTLQQSLQALTYTAVPGLGTTNSLAALGITTQEDGSLSIDSSVLSTALANDPDDVNAIFAQSAGSITDATSDLVDNYTMAGSGILSLRTNDLNDELSQMQDQVTTLQDRVNTYQTQLEDQFSSMQSIVTNYNNISAYLTALSDSSNSSSS